MLIFLIFGIFFFPKITAEDEIEIYRNKSIHWKIRCETEKETSTGYECVESKNTEMKYIVESPQNVSIGKLVKETKIEGCQHVGGCNLILQLGTVSK